MSSLRVLTCLLSLALVGCSQCGGSELTRTIPLLTPEQERVELGNTVVPDSIHGVIRLRSDGTGPVNINRVTLDGPATFSISGPSSTILQPGDRAEWTVTFAPSDAGEGDTDVVVESDAQNRPLLRIHVHATATHEPDCSDGNRCTTDGYDRVLRECFHTPNLLQCDDENACTTSDQCVFGRCLGQGVQCADANACTRDLCDVSAGCVFIDDGRACDDAEPCTAESCDATNGCRHTTLPDGMPCAVGTNTCVGPMACQAGRCTGAPLPDGSPCTDFLSCTTGDMCAGGVCRGEVPNQAQVSTRAHAFGTRGIQAATAHGDFLVTVERNLGFEPLASYPGAIHVVFADALQRPVTVAHALTLEGPFLSVTRIQSASAERLVLGGILRGPDGSNELNMVVIRTPPDAAPLVERVVVVGRNVSIGKSLSAFRDVAYMCQFGGTLHTVDLASGAVTSTETDCDRLAVDGSEGTLWMVLSTSAGGLRIMRRYSLSNPNVPVMEQEQPIPESSGGALPYGFGMQAVPGLGLFLQQLGALVLREPETLAVLKRWSVYGEGVTRTASGNVLLVLDGEIHEVTLTNGVVTSEAVGHSGLSAGSQPNSVSVGGLLAIWGRSGRLRLRALLPSGLPAAGEAEAHGLGGFGLMANVAGAPTSLSGDAVHVLRLEENLVAYDRSMAFSLEPAVISLGDSSNAPTFVLSGFRGDWVDAHGPGPEVLLGTLPGASDLVRGDGRFLYATDAFNHGPGGSQWTIQIKSHDVDTWVPSAVFVPVPLQTVEVTVTDPRRFHSAYPWTDTLNQRVVAAASFTQHPVDDNVTHLVMLDADHGAMQLRWQSRIDTSPSQTLGVVSHGDDVILLLTSPANLGVVDRLEHYRYVPSDGALRLLSTLDAPELLHALHFDGRTLMVASRVGLRIFNVADSGITVLGDLPLASRASSALVVQNQLWVTTNGTVDVFYPPCPPGL